MKNCASFLCAFFSLAAIPLVAKEVPYRIAGGEEVVLHLSEGGASPAKGNGITMENAGLIFDLKKGAPTMTPAFGFRLKKGLGLIRVLVEDVSDAEAVVLVDDVAPAVKEQRWLGQGAVTPVRAADFARMYERRITLKGFNPLKLLAADPKQSNPVVNATGSVRVYRVTVFTADSTKTVLIQPSWLGAGLLDRMELAISRAERAAPGEK